MSMFKALSLAAVLASGFAAPALADDTNGLGNRPNLGEKITEADIKPWNITVFPDGFNLPAGSGTAAAGAKVIEEKCARCHGAGAKGGKNAALVTDAPLPPGQIEANKTIKNFWANATTLYDYVRRAMPWDQPRTLSDQEVWDAVAYILAANKIIDEKAVMDAKSLPQVKMPNSDNFIIRFPERI
jgi:mono/diheme cytochrome c family protein